MDFKIEKGMVVRKHTVSPHKCIHRETWVPRMGKQEIKLTMCSLKQDKLQIYLIVRSYRLGPDAGAEDGERMRRKNSKD